MGDWGIWYGWLEEAMEEVSESLPDGPACICDDERYMFGF